MAGFYRPARMDTMQTPAGTLHVVATPIGNLADMSPRALDTLRAVDAICAEDTRHTRHLLAHFGIERPLLAVHEHNESRMAQTIVERLRRGEQFVDGANGDDFLIRKHRDPITNSIKGIKVMGDEKYGQTH